MLVEQHLLALGLGLGLTLGPLAGLGGRASAVVAHAQHRGAELLASRLGRRRRPGARVEQVQQRARRHSEVLGQHVEQVAGHRVEALVQRRGRRTQPGRRLARRESPARREVHLEELGVARSAVAVASVSVAHDPEVSDRALLLGRQREEAGGHRAKSRQLGLCRLGKAEQREATFGQVGTKCRTGRNALGAVGQEVVVGQHRRRKRFVRGRRHGRGHRALAALCQTLDALQDYSSSTTCVLAAPRRAAAVGGGTWRGRGPPRARRRRRPTGGAREQESRRCHGARMRSVTARRRSSCRARRSLHRVWTRT